MKFFCTLSRLVSGFDFQTAEGSVADHEHQFQPAGVEFEEQQTVHFADLFVPSLSYFGLI